MAAGPPAETTSATASAADSWSAPAPRPPRAVASLGPAAPERSTALLAGARRVFTLAPGWSILTWTRPRSILPGRGCLVPTYDLGDGVNLRYLARDRDGNAVAASVALAITRPDGTVDNVSVVATALGQYDAATYTPVASGDHRYRWTVTGAIVDTVNGQFTVANPAVPAYSSLTTVKRGLGKITSDDRDEDIQLSIVAASRMIDAATGRWPGAFVPDTVASVRVFPTAGRLIKDVGYMRSRILIDDLASATGVTVAGGTYASGVYSAISAFTPGPDNALARGLPISFLTMGSSTFYSADSIQVTGRWGWPAIPAEVEQATRLLAARLYKRRDSPQGVIASADWGAVRVSRTDPDVYALIQHLSIPGFA